MIQEWVAIIVAGGVGSRFGLCHNNLPKQYVRLINRPIITHAVEKFLELGIKIQPVIRHGDEELFAKAMTAVKYNTIKYETKSEIKPKIKQGAIKQEWATQNAKTRWWQELILPTCYGGRSRAESVYNGLRACKDLVAKYVLIHDAARPLITSELILAIISEIENGEKAAIPATPISDTIKQVNGDYVEKTIPRSNLVSVQTPQAFLYEEILALITSNMDANNAKQSLQNASKDTANNTTNNTIKDTTKNASQFPLENLTDEAMLFEIANNKIKYINGEKTNIKITTIEDLAYAKFLISKGQAK